MYWPSVQEGGSLSTSSPSHLVRNVLAAAPRIFGGSPTVLEMKDLPPLDSQTDFPIQSLGAMLQPITDKLSKHVHTATELLNQSTLTSVVCRKLDWNGGHENSACAR